MSLFKISAVNIKTRLIDFQDCGESTNIVRKESEEFKVLGTCVIETSDCITRLILYGDNRLSPYKINRVCNQ